MATPRSLLYLLWSGLLLAALLILGANYFLITLLLALALLPLLLVLGVVFLIKRKWVRPVLHAFVFCLVALVGTIVIGRLQHMWTTRQAARVVTALKRFRGQKKHYPDALEQLVPAFLPAVPSTSYRLFHPVPFYYHNDGVSFTLGYHYELVATCQEAYYNPEKGTWSSSN